MKRAGFKAAFAASLTALAALCACSDVQAADKYWAGSGEGGCGLWTNETAWAAAAGGEGSSAWAGISDYAWFTNSSPVVVDLGGATVAASSILTPNGSASARTFVTITNGVFNMNRWNIREYGNANYLKSAVVVFGDGAEVHNTANQWGFGLQQDTHLVFGKGSRFIEDNSGLNDQNEGKGENFIGANNTTSNSVTVCEGASVTLKRYLVVGGTWWPKDGGNSASTGVLHIKGGTLSGTVLHLGGNVSGNDVHNNNGNGIYVQDGGEVAMSGNLKFASTWNKSYQWYNSRNKFTLNAGSFTCNAVAAMYQPGANTISINGGTFWSKGNFRLGYTEADTQYIINNKLYLNGGVFKIGGTLFINDQNRTKSTTGGVWCNGGTIKPTASVSTSSGGDTRNFVIEAGGLKIDTDSGITFTLAQKVTSGAGKITKQGAGMLSITYPPYNQGGLEIEGGTARFKSGDQCVASGPVCVKSGAMLEIASGNTASRHAAAATLEDGAGLKLPYSSGTVVPLRADSFTFGGKVALSFSATPASGVYQILSATGGETFDESVLARFEGLPESASLFLSSDGKSVCCAYNTQESDAVWTGAGDGVKFSDSANWLNSAVPSRGGETVYFDGAAGTLDNDLPSFAPKSIVFGAGIGALSIGGNDIAGVESVTSLSTSVSPVIDAKVRFAGDIKVKQPAMDYATIGNAHVVFAGGAYAAQGCAHGAAGTWSIAFFGKYHFAKSSVTSFPSNNPRPALAAGSYLYIPVSDNLTELYLGAGAKAVVSNMTMTGKTRLAWHNEGEVVVTNLVLTGSGDVFSTYDTGTSVSPVTKIEKATMAMTGNYFYFSDGKGASKGTFYIGSGGLTFEKGLAQVRNGALYCFGRNTANNVETIHPWYSDVIFGSKNNGSYAENWDYVVHRSVVFDTDDESGTGRTITLDGILHAAASPAITIAGSGTFKVCKAADNATEPTVTVQGSATLVYMSGGTLGTGALNLRESSTLELRSGASVGGTLTLGGNRRVVLPEAGTATIAGQASFWTNSGIRFRVCETGNAKLAFGTAPSIEKNITISLTDDSRPLVGRSYVLTQGAGLNDTMLDPDTSSYFKLADGTPGTLSIVDGELVYNAPKYFYIKVR